MILRRSGKTTALLRSAIDMSRRNRKVYFVVWNHQQVPMVFDLLHQDALRGFPYHGVEVIAYDTYVRNARKFECVVFDHYVTECLAQREGRTLGSDHMEVYLRIGDWYQRKAIPVGCYDTRRYKMAVIEPMSAFAFGDKYPVDGSVCTEMKTVSFYETDEFKDGLPVYSNKP